MPVDEWTTDDGAREVSLREGPSFGESELPDAPDEGAFRLDLGTGQIWLSPELYTILGVDPIRFAPTFESLGELLDPTSAARLAAVSRRRETGPCPCGGRYWITRPDGRRRLVRLRVWAERAGLFGTAADVTDMLPRSERAQLLRRQESILRAVRDGVCGLDSTGRITFANPAMLRLLRREDENLVGRSLHDVVHRDVAGGEPHPSSECPYGRVPRPGSAVDSGVRRGDGSVIEVGFEHEVLQDDAEAVVIVTFRDISERRATARLLQTSLRQVQALSEQRGALLGHLAEAEERERLRIAANIHDDTIQALDAIALRLSNRGERATSDAERDAFADAEIEVREVSERLRRLMFELMPPDAGHDLSASLQTYCSVLFARSMMTYELVGDVDDVPPDRSLIAYRLLQEAARNAVKHSRGSRVRIELQGSGSELVARVSDNGVGMGDRTSGPTHAGLRIVRQRAEAVGGTARFATGLDGRGTTIELRLPFSREESR